MQGTGDLLQAVAGALLEARASAGIIEGREALLCRDQLDHAVGVDAFAEYLVVHLRREGLAGLRILRQDGGEHEVAFGEPVYTVAPGDNREYETACSGWATRRWSPRNRSTTAT